MGDDLHRDKKRRIRIWAPQHGDARTLGPEIRRAANGERKTAAREAANGERGGVGEYGVGEQRQKWRASGGGFLGGAMGAVFSRRSGGAARATAVPREEKSNGNWTEGVEAVCWSVPRADQVVRARRPRARAGWTRWARASVGLA